MKSVLRDESDDVMVRHEAAEALGAIGEGDCKEILHKHLSDTCREVAETCELALRRIQDVEGKTETEEDSTRSQIHQGNFNTVDPALVSKAVQERGVEELEAVALDESINMHDRYEAIFAIRNKGGSVAIDLLSKLLRSSSSALLKHEVLHLATADDVRGTRTIQEIQYRGQWADPRSCNRYRKAGRYNKILAQLPRNLTSTLDAQQAALIHAVG